MFDLDRWNEIWETIVRNKKRSIMTALGVFWGIFMLVVLLGGGLGLGKVIFGELGGMSSNTAFFFTNQTSIPYQGMPSGRWWNFSNDDIEAIDKNVPGVKYVAGMNWGGNQNVSYMDRKGEYFLMGYTAQYNEIAPQNIRFGRFLNEIDIQEKRKVCAIGSQIWKELFPNGENPVGKTIKMNSTYMTIVGVLEKTSNMTIGSDPETTIAAPVTLIQQMFNRGNYVNSIIVTAYDDYNIAEVQEECKKVIAANHIISPDDPKAIGGFSFAERVGMINGLFRGINLLTWIVGLGTLLAGIVGVSNIMLVIVRERTQEIGVRRALGAPPRSIITQILSESFILTFIAGILGLAAAVGVLSIADNIIAAMRPDGPAVSFQITFWMGLLAAGIIILGSVLAGFIPANRALKIKAVDAIREE